MTGWIAAPASAQDILMSATGPRAGAQFGWSVAWGPDLDGDGFREVAVGAPTYDPTSRGIASVLSGRDYSPLATIKGPFKSGFGGAVCWCGDLDGDGVSDLAVGAPSDDVLVAAKVYIYSSATWATLRVLNSAQSYEAGFGQALADPGDLNGDGIDDLLIGSPYAGGGFYGTPPQSGTVYLVSGADGTTIWTLVGSAEYANLGSSVAVVGDLNGDGVVDIAIGAPGGRGSSSHRKAGEVLVVSGSDGSVLQYWSGHSRKYYTSSSFSGPFYFGDQLGWAVGPAGDFDGDGVPDAWAASEFGYTYPGPYVTVFSGATGAVLLTVVLPTSLQFDAAAIADVNGDGRAEFVSIGVNKNNSSGALVFSSVDGKILWQTDAIHDDFYFGTVASDRTNSSDFILGLPRNDDVATDAGKVELRAARSFWLDVAPTHFPLANDTLTFTAAEGPTGNPAGLFVTAVNGTPTFGLLTLATFDATGAAALATGTVPPGLAGNTVALRAIGVAANGHLVDSADELLTLR